MKKLTATLCLTLAVLFGSEVRASDFLTGLEEYKKGNLGTALRIWKPLAEQGNADAQYNLGMMYKRGRVVQRDFQKAVKWFELASKNGSTEGTYNLAVAYHKGQHVEKNLEYALKLYHIAAWNGYADAEFQVGNFAFQRKEYKSASNWYRLAAEQGHTEAQQSLGASHHKGLGVLQDYVRAHMWGNIAASNESEEGSKLLDLVTKQMTSAQLEKAQDLARECVRKKYKGC